jgi:hypothetical protein
MPPEKYTAMQRFDVVAYPKQNQCSRTCEASAADDSSVSREAPLH